MLFTEMGTPGAGKMGFQALDRHPATLHTSPPGPWLGDWLCVAHEDKVAKHPQGPCPLEGLASSKEQDVGGAPWGGGDQ